MIPDRDGEYIKVSLPRLKYFLIDNKFKIKDIEYISIRWTVEYPNPFDFNELDKQMLEGIVRTPNLVIYYNYGPSHR